MGAQSAVLAYQFGIHYEWGKRTVRAMSNDEFNLLVTNEDARLQFQGGIAQVNQQVLDRFVTELPTFLGLQDKIIEASVAIEIAKAKRTPSAFVEIMQAFGGATLDEVGTQLDTLSEAERAFLLSVNPMLAILYSLYKLGLTPTDTVDPDPTLEHTDIIGHELHPEHPDVDPEPLPIEEKQVNFTWINEAGNSFDAGFFGNLDFHITNLASFPTGTFNDNARFVAYKLAIESTFNTILT